MYNSLYYEASVDHKKALISNHRRFLLSRPVFSYLPNLVICPITTKYPSFFSPARDCNHRQGAYLSVRARWQLEDLRLRQHAIELPVGCSRNRKERKQNNHNWASLHFVNSNPFNPILILADWQTARTVSRKTYRVEQRWDKKYLRKLSKPINRYYKETMTLKAIEDGHNGMNPILISCRVPSPLFVLFDRKRNERPSYSCYTAADQTSVTDERTTKLCGRRLIHFRSSAPSLPYTWKWCSFLTLYLSPSALFFSRYKDWWCIWDIRFRKHRK